MKNYILKEVQAFHVLPMCIIITTLTTEKSKSLSCEMMLGDKFRKKGYKLFVVHSYKG